MSEINCEKCQNIPEQFVCLDCDHTFCLNCLSKQFKQQENQIQCEKCYEITVLDFETIDALIQVKIKLLQPPTIIPYTTNKKHIQQESIIVKGHPFLEKLNISIEKLLDQIRSIQFDKQQLREIGNKLKQDIDQEFKSLHLYLDQKFELYMNDIIKYESNIQSDLQLQEDTFQLDIEEMQIMKEQIKSILNKQQNGMQNDIEQFKDILNTIDNMIIKQQSQQYQSKLKEISDEFYKIPLNQNEFSRQYKQFFANLDKKILQIDNRQQNSQFITANRLEKIQQSLATQLSSTSVKPIKINHKSHISLCSPPRNSFLQEEFQVPRKSSRIEIIGKINNSNDNRMISLNRRNNRTIVPNLNLAGITFMK